MKKAMIIMLPVVCVGLIAARADKPADQKTFQDSFEKAATKAKQVSPSYGPSVESLAPIAENLIKNGGNVDTAFLSEVIQQQDSQKPYRLMLAKIVLAKNGGEKAIESLCKDFSSGPYAAENEIIFLMSPRNLRAFGEKALIKNKKADFKIVAANYLGMVGDKESINVLKKEAAKTTHVRARKEMEAAAEKIAKRLKEVPAAKQEEWIRQELLLRRAMVGKDFIIREGSLRAAQKTLIKQKTVFTESFLREAIKSKENLAIIMAGSQREKNLVPDLVDALKNNVDFLRKKLLLGSLAEIGTPAAISAIGAQLNSASIEENRRIAKVIGLYGTKEMIPLLEELLKDKEYKSSWPIFEWTIKNIKRRLDGKKKTVNEAHPSSQPGEKNSGDILVKEEEK